MRIITNYILVDHDLAVIPDEPANTQKHPRQNPLHSKANLMESPSTLEVDYDVWVNSGFTFTEEVKEDILSSARPRLNYINLKLKNGTGKKDILEKEARKLEEIIAAPDVAFNKIKETLSNYKVPCSDKESEEIKKQISDQFEKMPSEYQNIMKNLKPETRLIFCNDPNASYLAAHLNGQDSIVVTPKALNNPNFYQMIREEAVHLIDEKTGFSKREDWKKAATSDVKKNMHKIHVFSHNLMGFTKDLGFYDNNELAKEALPQIDILQEKILEKPKPERDKLMAELKGLFPESFELYKDFKKHAKELSTAISFEKAMNGLSGQDLGAISKARPEFDFSERGSDIISTKTPALEKHTGKTR